MKIDFVRFKVPVCFLVMTLAALAVVIIMSSGEAEATNSYTTTDNVQSVTEGEEMSSAFEGELLFF